MTLSTSLTVISENIEGLTASKASMLSEMYKREHCNCLCIQDTHRAPHLARPKIPGMTLIAERAHIKHGSAILIRSDLKVKGVSVWEQDIVELISIEMPGVVVHSVCKPPTRSVYYQHLDTEINLILCSETSMEKRLNSGQICATSH